MKAEQIIPILRIFDYQKAIEFYIGWLGFEIVWEHRFEENMPVYIEVKKENMVFHLSEHHGDANPEAVFSSGVKELQNIIRSLLIKTTNTIARVLKKRFMMQFLLRCMTLLGIKLFSMKRLTMKSTGL